MKRSPKFFYQFCRFVLLGGISIEVLLRLLLGLGNPVLLQADPDIGYYFQPNQTRFRFGKTIQYNQYAQRSEAITETKPAGTLRILMVGDSVLNGGSLTDQQDTISQRLQEKLSTENQRVEVLNASAGSWGIGNQLAYLRQFGTFNSDVIILQIGTHDLTQPKSTDKRIGYDPNYPNQLPSSAVTELFTRYLMPRIQLALNLRSISGEIPLTSQPEVEFQKNQQYFQDILTFILPQKIPIFVLFTPNQVDVIPKATTPLYKPQFLQTVKSSEVELIDSHQMWSTLPPQTVENYFRDKVHLSVAGNEAIAQLIADQIQVKLPNQTSFTD